MHAVTMSERNEGVILRAISRISRLIALPHCSNPISGCPR